MPCTNVHLFIEPLRKVLNEAKTAKQIKADIHNSGFDTLGFSNA